MTSLNTEEYREAQSDFHASFITILQDKGLLSQNSFSELLIQFWT